MNANSGSENLVFICIKVLCQSDLSHLYLRQPLYFLALKSTLWVAVLIIYVFSTDNQVEVNYLFNNYTIRKNNFLRNLFLSINLMGNHHHSFGRKNSVTLQIGVSIFATVAKNEKMF